MEWDHDGMVYSGDFKNNLREGQGIENYDKSGKYYYTGQWKAGLKHGTGE